MQFETILVDHETTENPVITNATGATADESFANCVAVSETLHPRMKRMIAANPAAFTMFTRRLRSTATSAMKG